MFVYNVNSILVYSVIYLYLQGGDAYGFNTCGGSALNGGNLFHPLVDNKKLKQKSKTASGGGSHRPLAKKINHHKKKVKEAVKMFQKGFSFKVTKNGITGIINGVVDNFSSRIYSVSFYENGKLYYMADVFEETISNNLKYGYYEEI